MNLNLLMAVVWFVVGVGLLVVTWTMGDDALPFRVRFLPISPGWLALLLCVYNVVRWWSRPRPRRDPLAAALEARRRMHRERETPARRRPTRRSTSPTRRRPAPTAPPVARRPRTNAGSPFHPCRIDFRPGQN